MKIRAVIFDWAGTVVDYGCHAPVAVLERIFAAEGVELHPEESRHAMGLLKRDQIREILGLARVKSAWQERHGEAPTEAAVERLFEAFIPLQIDCIEEYSTVIDGVPEVVEELRRRGIRIGSTTGYTRAMLERLLPLAARQGYAPDCVVTPDDVGAGRPQPWMIFENLRRLNVCPPGACLKVGDTVSDMQEGRNAGCPTAGVAASSSDAAVFGEDYARAMLEAAGAVHVISTAAQLIPVIEEL